MTDSESEHRAGSAAPTASTSSHQQHHQSSTNHSKKEAKKRKVGQACVYCRRSHMTCDSERPCKRCIKRDIGHLCHDETPGKGHGHAHHAMPKKNTTPSQSAMSKESHTGTTSVTPTTSGAGEALQTYIAAMAADQQQGNNGSMSSQLPSSSSAPPPPAAAAGQALGGAGFLGLGGSDGMLFQGLGAAGGGDAAGGNEYNLLSEFLESLDGAVVGGAAGPSTGNDGTGGQDAGNSNSNNSNNNNTSSSPWAPAEGPTSSSNDNNPAEPPAKFNGNKRSRPNTPPPPPNDGAYAPASLRGFSTKKEKFFLTAADQVDGPRDERLSKVIQAKYDAGLLRPYNHVKGYARLSSWMDGHVSPASRRRILQPLSVFRPRFRAVAAALSDIDLIYIEEAFERLLLDYDRVFSTQGIPACLWRRTGEIYKGNREFAELVGVGIEELREGRVAIYEFMQEESACNYWEKYGSVSFDTGQKAVLTSCVLTPRDATQGQQPSRTAATNTTNTTAENSGMNTPATVTATANAPAVLPNTSNSTSITTTLKNRSHINCCFSFTIRRDSFGCPTAIVGNFLPISSSGA